MGSSGILLNIFIWLWAQDVPLAGHGIYHWQASIYTSTIYIPSINQVYDKIMFSEVKCSIFSLSNEYMSWITTYTGKVYNSSCTVVTRIWIIAKRRYRSKVPRYRYITILTPISEPILIIWNPRTLDKLGYTCISCWKTRTSYAIWYHWVSLYMHVYVKISYDSDILT